MLQTMATLTIRNLPTDLVDRLKKVAARNGRSMEQEVRELLLDRYPDRDELWRRIDERRKDLPEATTEQVQAWIDEARKESRRFQ